MHSGSFEYRISDGGPAPHMPSSPSPFDAKHVGLIIESVEYHGIYHRNIGVNRREVPGQIAVDENGLGTSPP